MTREALVAARGYLGRNGRQEQRLRRVQWGYEEEAEEEQRVLLEAARQMRPPTLADRMEEWAGQDGSGGQGGGGAVGGEGVVGARHRAAGRGEDREHAEGEADGGGGRE